MRLRLSVLLFSLLIYFSSSGNVYALEKFGPHITDHTNSSFITSLRKLYDQAGTPGWVPATVMIRPNIGGPGLSALLGTLKQNKFWPVIRIYNEGGKFSPAQIDSLTEAFAQANTETDGFPRFIIIEFGNEVNYGSVEWSGTADPVEYKNLLSDFISKIKLRAPSFGVANGAMNISLAHNPAKGNYEAVKFWAEGPKEIIGQLDALAFNSYELNQGQERYSINSWKWEWEQIGSPAKLILITEFGYNPGTINNPGANLTERLNYIKNEYQAFKKGERQNLEKVTAVTPLLYLGGQIKVPVFSSSGSVSWYDFCGNNLCGIETPDSDNEGEDSLGKDQTAGQPASSHKSKKKELERINRTYLPLLNIKPVSLFEEENPPENDQSSTSDLSGEYALAVSRRVAGHSISSNLGSFFSKILGFLGIKQEGEKQADNFAKSYFPFGVGGEGEAYKSLDDRKLVYNQSQPAEDSDSGSVLGLFSRDPLLDSLDQVKCANAPFGLFKNCSIRLTQMNSEIPERITTPTSPPGIPDPIYGDEGLSSPSSGESLSYYIPYYKTSRKNIEIINNISRRLPSYMPMIEKAVKKRWPDSLIDRWPEVVKDAESAGFNPAFALSIWIEETAASSVCSLAERLSRQDDIFGYGIDDFGIDYLDNTLCGDSASVKADKFVKQKEGFMKLYDYYLGRLPEKRSDFVPPVDFDDFMCMYSRDSSAPCDFKSLHAGFVERLRLVYDCLVKPEKNNCPGYYFSLEDLPQESDQKKPEKYPEPFDSAGIYYYSQQDPRWADVNYPKSCGVDKSGLPKYMTLAKGGCGPTTVSMMASTMVDRQYEPVTVLNRYYSDEDTGCDGTTYYRAKEIFNGLGLSTVDIFSYYEVIGGKWLRYPKPISYVIQDLKHYIDKGYYIFALGEYWSENSNSWTGHFFWILDIDNNGTILINDPWKGEQIIQNNLSPQPKYIMAMGVKKK